MRSIVLTILAAGLQILLFPKFDLFFLAWIMIVPFLAAVSRKKPFASFLLGVLFGLISALGVTYWLYYSVVGYFGLSPLMGVCFIVAASLFYAAIYFGLFGFLLSLCRPLVEKRVGILIIPCFWVLCEILRGWWLSEDPWGILGYSQYKFIPLVQIADTTGVYGISFVIVMVNVALYRILAHLWSRHKKDSHPVWSLRDWGFNLVLPLLVVGAVLLYGFLALKEQENTCPDGKDEIQVALIQANIPSKFRWKSIYYGKNLATYLRMTRSPAVKGADLVVWPENAINFHPDREPLLFQILKKSIGDPPITLLTGAPYMDKVPGENRSTNYNAAFLITPEGIQKKYEKIHLMPVSERKPAWLRSVLKSPGESPSVFSAGEEATVFPFENTRFSSPICFEMVYPELIRRFIRNGAEFLVNISNDSWFGPTAGPFQHLVFSTLRAVENRRWVLRAANTGISAIVAPTGRIVYQAPLHEKEIKVGRICPQTRLSLYTRYGDVFAYVCAFVTLGSFFVSLWGRRR